MKYLVTGSTGIVGRYIVRELIENCVQHNVDQVVSLSRKNRYLYEDHPMKDTGALQLACWGDLLLGCTRLITQYKPDIIIHCAGLGTQNAPAKDLWRANVDTTFNLLEACGKLYERVKFIYCSSIVVDDWPKTMYATSKLAGEKLSYFYGCSYNNIKSTVISFPAVAGAGNKHGVVKAIIDKLMIPDGVLNLLNNSRKPFVYTGQLAEKIVHIANQDYIPSKIQICPTDSITVEDIAREAMHIIGNKRKIVWNGDWQGDMLKVFPIKSDFSMLSSKEAIKLAIQHILREDYGYAV